MNLYHGTNTRFLTDILKNGLRPRGEGETGNWAENPSMEGFVYATVAHPFWYAISSIPDLPNTEDNPVVFEIDTDRLPANSLYPDEDYLRQRAQDAQRQGTILADWSEDIAQMQHVWQASLDQMGSVAIQGGVPRHALTRYVVLDKTRHVYLLGAAYQAEINLGDYALFGEQSRSLVQHIFDRGPISFIELELSSDVPLEQQKQLTSMVNQRNGAMRNISRFQAARVRAVKIDQPSGKRKPPKKFKLAGSRR